MSLPVLQIENLSLGFQTEEGLLRAVDDVSLTVEEGQIVSLVGESGCGKSITAQSIARLIPSLRYLGGRILLEGQNTLTLSRRELRKIRGKGVSYIFQDPSLALNPTLTIGTQILEALALHQPQRACRAECVAALSDVGIPSAELRVDEYPHQLSGGMKQRAVIAMALASRPRLLVADEPTTALDVTIQAQILQLLSELRTAHKMSILLITHNLGIVSQMADKVAVMYAGQLVESGPVGQVLKTPAHPYTRALLASVPRLDSQCPRLSSIEGQVPPLHAMPEGCRFHPRCTERHSGCTLGTPILRAHPTLPDHRVRCMPPES